MLQFNFDSYKMLAFLITLNILLPISHSMHTSRNVVAAEKAAIPTGEGNGAIVELEEEELSKKKKQLHIAHYAGLQIETPPKGYGGKEKVVEMLVFEHLRMGYKVTLFATKNSGQLEKFNEKYQLTQEQLANFTLIPSSRDAWHYAKIDVADNIEYIREYLKVIVKNVRENNFDIVHIHSYDFFKHDPTLYNEFNAKTVTTLHGSLGDIELAKKMERYPNMQIVSITMNQRTHVHSDVPLNWVGNIYNAYPKSLYQFTPVSNPMPWPKPHVFGEPSKRGVPYLAFLGKFSPDKGALNAVKIALKANMELRIAAKAAEYQNQKYYEKILHLAKGNEHLIKYIGEIVDSEKSSFLGNAKALIFPIEWQEPFGLVMIEAMACGTPVIAPRSASVPEVLTDGVTGLLFDVELVENEAGEKMAQYTDEVIETAAELVKKLDTLDRHRIRFTFENQFSMEKMMNGYGEIYAKMLDTASAVIELERKSVLHIWMRAKQKNKPATLYFSTLKRKEIVLHSTAVNEWFEFIKLDMSERIGEEEGKQQYTFSWFKTDTEISYLYAFEPDNVQEVGIRPAFVHNKARHHPDLHKFSYHLRAPLGWNNEPNGFIRTNDNLYHVFYQFIPNESNRFWFGKIEEHLKNPSLEAMHWGHAVSKDLINWVHQPVYLLPKYKRDEALRKEKWVEHWFSGSAVPMGEKGLRMFVTSFNLARPNWSMQKEIRTTNAIKAEKERVMVEDFPQNAHYHGVELKFKQFNFRDPYVFKGPHGYYYMTVATSDTRGLGRVILLYRTVSTGLDSGWEFQNILLNDNRDGFQNIECTSMFPLGDPANSETRYALLYAREYGTADDPYRARDTKLRLGHFDGKQFKTISEQTLDFAFGSYGHQGFYDEKSGETLMMGWLGWWIDWDIKSAFYSSQTLPRIMRIASDNTLLVGPHPNVLKLLRDEENKLMPQNNGEEGKNDGSIQKILLPNKTAYILLRIDQHKIGKQQHVLVELEHEKYSELRVVISQEGLELVKKIRVLEGGVEKRPLIAKGARPDKVHIFIDIDSLEIYGELDKDKGMPRWSGTARLTGNGTSSVESVKIKGGVVKFEAWQMNSVKMPGYYDAGENGHEGGMGGQNIGV